MLFDNRVRRVAGRTSLGLALLGASAAALAATHPASAASVFDALANTVTCGTSAACVAGKNTGSGPGVGGTSAKGIGVQGSGNKYGVQGTGTVSYGVFGTSKSGLAGVTGTTASNNGVYGYTTSSSGGTGVYGVSKNGYGLYGTTTSGNGYGVVGTVSAAGTGTYGGSASGYGLEGISSSGYGLYANGSGTGTAIYAAANTGYGLIAYTNGNVPIYARNSNGNGADIEGTYIGIIGRAPASGGFPLVATDENGNDLFYVDGAGNVSYHGGLFNFARVGGGMTVKAFTAKTTLPTVEDTGTAQLVGGSAAVRLDKTFAASMDAASSYRVFVTPNGDTRGLFVASKTPNGFIVRESQGGRSNVSFDYRIVATSFGQAGQRMAVMAGSAGLPRAIAPIAPHLKPAKTVPTTPLP